MRSKNLLPLSAVVLMLLGATSSAAFAYSSAYFFGIYQSADGGGNASITEPNWVAVGDVLIASYGHSQPDANVQMPGFTKIRTTTLAGGGPQVDTFCRVATSADAFRGITGGHQYTMSGFTPGDTIFGQIINVTGAALRGDFSSNGITACNGAKCDQAMPVLGTAPSSCTPDFVGDNTNLNASSQSVSLAGVHPSDVVYMVGVETNVPHSAVNNMAFNVPLYDDIMTCDVGGCNGIGSSGNPYEMFNINVGSAVPATLTASAAYSGPFIVQVISLPSTGTVPSSSPTPTPAPTALPTASPTSVATPTPFPPMSALLSFNPNSRQTCSVQVNCNPTP
jgi:hypothetical protein